MITRLGFRQARTILAFPGVADTSVGAEGLAAEAEERLAEDSNMTTAKRAPNSSSSRFMSKYLDVFVITDRPFARDISKRGH